MLSIENSPPDPSCPRDIPQLKTGSDERASHKLPFPDVDLSRPALFDDTPPPKFSIRDYVFTARSKDIKTNWPFSSKILQLCLKHDVKDALPPFQPLDKLRNQSLKSCLVERGTPENRNLSNCDEEHSGPNDHEELDLAKNAHLNKKSAQACIETSSCRSEGENEFPSTTTSVTQSDIESLPTNRLSSSRLDSDTLPEPSVEVEAAGLASAHKTESTTRCSGKKCRLVMKFGANSDRSSTEDLASNSSNLTELTMTSKICPVCKTFSSSSNTTLNAHIDQCLSVESAPKWMADSKLTKHRIKPRKTRLMVDIYAAAARCTLEDLDRRNGTNWATVSSLAMRDNDKCEMPAEGKKQRILPVHTADTSNVGAVYIDATGTKLRILSKLNDAPSVSQLGEDLETRKPSKGGKGSKFLLTKKRKHRASRHHKYFKLAQQSKKKFSHKSHSPQVFVGQGVYHGVEERCEKKEHEIKKQAKPSDSGNLRQWVCSKRTEVAKKVNRKDNNQPVESDQFCFGDHPLMERSQISKLTNVSPISSPGNTERMNPFFEAQASDEREQSPGRKTVGSPLSGTRSSDSVERSLPPMNGNINQLGKNNNSICDGCALNPPKSSGACVSLLSSKLDDIAAGPNHNSVISLSASTDSPRSYPSLTSKATKFSSLRRNGLAVRSRSSTIKSGADVIKKCSAFKTSQVHLIAEIGDEVADWYSEANQQHDLIPNHMGNHSGREHISDKVSLGSGTVQKVKRDRDAISMSGRQEAMALKSSQLAPQFYGSDEGGCMDFSVRVCDDFLDKANGPESAGKEIWVHGEDVVAEPVFKEAVREGDTSVCQSVDPELHHKLGNSTDTRSNLVGAIEDYRGRLCGAEALRGPTKPTLVDGQEMYCADEAGNDFIGQSGRIREDMDSDVGQRNFSAEVDPIPIPGPPGSFLPSPRGMGSEDLQGNSSLTTSRVQSSQDQRDFIDGDSSDSPISETSTISNSPVAGYDQKYPSPLSSVGPQSVQDKMRSGFSGGDIEPSAESAAVAPQTTYIGVDRLTFDGENCKVNKIPIEKGPLSFRSDEPCCCQRKERTSHGLALNYQESQLLKRRAVASVSMPSMGKQKRCNLNTRPCHFDPRPEILSPSSCPSSNSEKVIPHTRKSPAGTVPLKDSPDAVVTFPGRRSRDSASPTASNPILRLMGKNLMVVNKDEDASMPLEQTQPQPHLNALTPRFQKFSEVSCVNFQPQFYHPYHHMVPQIGQDSHSVGHCSDERLSNSFRSHATPNAPQTLTRAPVGLFPHPHKDGAFVALMEPHDYEGQHNMPAQQNKSNNRPIGAPTYKMEKFLTVPECQKMMSGHPAANYHREIIIIDDIPDSETHLTTEVTKYSGGLRERQVLISSGITIPTLPSHNSRHVNAFSYYQSWDPSLVGELPAVHKAGFRACPARGSNASSARWSCTSEDSGGPQRSPFFAVSPSTGHLRSALYNFPSLR